MMLQAGTGLIALGVVIVNLEKLQRSKGGARPVPESSAVGSEAGLPQHRYQPLSHPAPAAAQAGGGSGWWRRLWGGAAPPPPPQQQLEEQEWLPDYRGRLKAKHSGQNLEVHLEMGAATHAEERNNGGGGGGWGMNVSGSAAPGQRP